MASRVITVNGVRSDRITIRLLGAGRASGGSIRVGLWIGDLVDVAPRRPDELLSVKNARGEASLANRFRGVPCWAAVVDREGWPLHRLVPASDNPSSRSGCRCGRATPVQVTVTVGGDTQLVGMPQEGRTTFGVDPTQEGVPVRCLVSESGGTLAVVLESQPFGSQQVEILYDGRALSPTHLVHISNSDTLSGITRQDTGTASARSYLGGGSWQNPAKAETTTCP